VRRAERGGHGKCYEWYIGTRLCGEEEKEGKTWGKGIPLRNIPLDGHKRKVPKGQGYNGLHNYGTAVESYHTAIEAHPWFRAPFFPSI